jgi:hypothetical protein
MGAVQRLTTPSYVICRNETDATRWCWYWNERKYWNRFAVSVKVDFSFMLLKALFIRTCSRISMRRNLDSFILFLRFFYALDVSETTDVVGQATAIILIDEFVIMSS